MFEHFRILGDSSDLGLIVSGLLAARDYFQYFLKLPDVLRAVTCAFNVWPHAQPFLQKKNKRRRLLRKARKSAAPSAQDALPTMMVSSLATNASLNLFEVDAAKKPKPKPTRHSILKGKSGRPALVNSTVRFDSGDGAAPTTDHAGSDADIDDEEDDRGVVGGTGQGTTGDGKDSPDRQGNRSSLSSKLRALGKSFKGSSAGKSVQDDWHSEWQDPMEDRVPFPAGVEFFTLCSWLRDRPDRPKKVTARLRFAQAKRKMGAAARLVAKLRKPVEPVQVRALLSAGFNREIATRACHSLRFPWQKYSNTRSRSQSKASVMGASTRSFAPQSSHTTAHTPNAYSGNAYSGNATTGARSMRGVPSQRSAADPPSVSPWPEQLVAPNDELEDLVAMFEALAGLPIMDPACKLPWYV